jgi:predicted PurR-regulated permease PerM
MINFVIFFTALFYLLGSSTTMYKPVEMFSSCIPGDGKHSKRFLTAVEEAVNGVFTASFKMALFYGMWTWLIHTLFQINIVFVPSFLAALFGAVPLLMPYWAAIPAVLELFLIQGEWTLAILMMLAQMAPMSMVDTQIYSEIKGGGHPYLTGLAVAGGIFCFGIQGAIMGPVILCCVFVALKVGTSYLRSETDEEYESGVGKTGSSN